MVKQNRPVLITINLLPGDRKRVSFDWVPKVLTIAAVILVASSVMAVNFYYVIGNMALRSRKAGLEGRIAAIQSDVERVRAMEKEIDVLHRKQDIINDLVVNRIEWARKLNQLSDILPAQVWLEEVALVVPKGRDAAKKGEQPQKILRVVGVTNALEHARSLEAAFIYNIMHSPFIDDFETVQLVKSERTEWSGSRNFTVWQFELQLPLRKRGQPATPPESDKAKKKPTAKPKPEVRT